MDYWFKSQFPNSVYKKSNFVMMRLGYFFYYFYYINKSPVPLDSRKTSRLIQRFFSLQGCVEVLEVFHRASLGGVWGWEGQFDIVVPDCQSLRVFAGMSWFVLARTQGLIHSWLISFDKPMIILYWRKLGTALRHARIVPKQLYLVGVKRDTMHLSGTRLSGSTR